MNNATQTKKEIALNKRKLEKGDISSGYKLYEIYKNGVFKKNADGEATWIQEKSPKLAEYYLGECEKLLRQNESDVGFHVTNLNLTEFRKFNSLKVKFDRNLTVIIGDNGAGKTTILDGITKALSWLSSNILKKSGIGKRVTEYDVNVGASTYAEVELKVSLTKNSHYKVSLCKGVKGAVNAKSSQLDAFEELGDLYRVVDNKNRSTDRSEINLPLIVSYSVNRTNIKSNKTFDLEKISSVEISSKYDVYENKSIDGTGNFDEFSEWFLALHNRSGENLSDQLTQSKKRLKSLEAAGANDKFSDLFDLYRDAESEYKLLKAEYESREIYIKQLEIVKGAIVSTVPGFANIFIDKRSGRAELKVTVDGQDMNIFQISQGQHVFISIIADIAKKLVSLNPSLANPLEGQGIVLIDEIELHLHPKWQQNIINSLRQTFPNIQFVVTTHSPQVLSTVDKTCVRMFLTDENGIVQCLTPKFQTKGVRSADILAQIMGTNSVPDVKEAHDVDYFSELLVQGEKESALSVLKNLEEHFGSEHPVILDCKNKVEVFDMKERIRAKQNRGA